MRSLRSQVLSLYRQILRTGQSWPSVAEQMYIAKEAQTSFRASKSVSDASAISKLLSDAQQRLEIGVHYKNPYPRLHNLPPGSTGEQSRKHKLASLQSSASSSTSQSLEW
ncbi:mitochondrial Complex1_LYR family protein [Andalucia godoyi]|uniref:Mitochondrial Complex1_LYR family protein n=1 Tax=Andalucia godoyi TaxID=505711 RepID=A0A8K0AHD3_ANDGO|nr:mitochondrial Complex1_LYR family protein [Andalucia godoyi]|eukprot:ANDGO_07154.mRNA.1 mitochondrial Complex1_LYR family protein